MDVLENLPKDTKISDLTVEQFEAVMLRTFCRVADFAAVRFAQEQQAKETNYFQRPRTEEEKQFINNRAEGVREIQKLIGDSWPKFSVYSFVPTEKKPETG